jgi:hypothetical protein
LLHPIGVKSTLHAYMTTGIMEYWGGQRQRVTPAELFLCICVVGQKNRLLQKPLFRSSNIPIFPINLYR